MRARTRTPERFDGRATVRALGRAFVFAAAVSAAGAGTVAADPASSAVPPQPDGETIAHILNRLGFGPAAGDVARVRRAGLAGYIEAQLHPERIPEPRTLESRLAKLETLDRSSRAIARRYVRPVAELRRELRQERAVGSLTNEQQARLDAAVARRGLVGTELGQQKILRAVYSRRQLEEVLVDFWFNHFNVFAGGDAYAYVTEYEREAIRPHVLGSFRELLGAVARSPAMLVYLDNWRSVGPRSQAAREAPRRGLNENYARELLELHTLGVDGGYTQEDVVEVAKCFTGWTTPAPARGRPFAFDAHLHEPGPKRVLGRTIDRGGLGDGEAVLDLLAAHPSTARLVATKLARRFVADDPPEALVTRAAARFQQTGGDLREVVQVVVTSPEIFDPDVRGAKIKSPFELVASALRAVDADIKDARPLVSLLRGLGMPLYGANPPTGYIDRGDSWTGTGAFVGRLNFAVALAHDRVDGVAVSLDRPRAAAVRLGAPDFQTR